MTRAQGPGLGLSYRSVSPAGARRCVLVLRSGALATVDPEPRITAVHDTRLLLVEIDAPGLDDPPAFGGETPAGSTAARVLELLSEEVPEGPFGVVGERAAALFAVALAATLASRVDRLALVAAPLPDGPLACDLLAATLGRVTADTVIVNAEADADAPGDAARWYATRLPRGRAEILAPVGPPALDGRVALSAVWARVLDHVGRQVATP